MAEGAETIKHTGHKPRITSAHYCAAALIVTLALFILSRSNYLLFHNIVELFGVALAITLFSIGWHTREITRNAPLTLLAVSFLVIGILDLLHTLSYKGMGVFPGAGVDPPTQFWIAARFTEAISYLLAALLMVLKVRINPLKALYVYCGVGALLIFSIWPGQFFPSCLVEGQGLTPFKITCEYVIASILALSGVIFCSSKKMIPAPLLKLLLWSIAFTIASEMAFTLYTDVFGVMNVVGHLLKFISLVLVYRALVYGALKDPFQTLFKDLDASHRALDQELTYRRSVEDDLRKTNRELDAFIHSVSHDLKTPLATISGNSELLGTLLADQLEDQNIQLLNTISNQGHHIADIIDNLLSLASVGNIDSEPEKLVLESIAAHAVADLSREIEAAGCRVEIKALPELLGHSSLLYQLFLNLVSNAVRHGATPDQPIEICGEKTAGGIIIRVIDHGPGIPEDEREEIFEAFYRGTKAKKAPGTGIGLATVAKIARFYKGSVHAEETPGGGTTFRVILHDVELDTSRNT